jgi:hypothetical protein
MPRQDHNQQASTFMSDYRDSIVKSYYDAMRGVSMVSSTHHVGYQMGLAEAQRQNQRQAQSNGAATGGDDMLEVMARSIPDRGGREIRTPELLLPTAPQMTI